MQKIPLRRPHLWIFFTVGDSAVPKNEVIRVVKGWRRRGLKHKKMFWNVICRAILYLFEKNPLWICHAFLTNFISWPCWTLRLILRIGHLIHLLCILWWVYFIHIPWVNAMLREICAFLHLQISPQNPRGSSSSWRQSRKMLLK